MAGEDDPWLQETVIEFLRGPCYTSPLLSFIDEKCAVFDSDEENKLEYTQIHNEFKEVVDSLISDFLEEIGVSPEQFVETVSSTVSNNQLSSFVLSSILTVEDFLQFKAMMVKRNIDLTNQVLAMIESQQIDQVMKQHADWQEELNKLDGMSDEQMLEEALRLSKEQFANLDGSDESQLAAAFKASNIANPDAEFSEEFKQAMALSLREQNAIDLEEAQLEQALALSLALEQEQQAMQREQPPAAPAPAAPAATPAAPAAPAAATPTPAATPAAPLPTPSPTVSPPAIPPAPAPAPAPTTAAPSAPSPTKADAAPAPALPEVKSPARTGAPYVPSPAPAAAAAATPVVRDNQLPAEFDVPAVALGNSAPVRGARAAAGYSSSAGDNPTADFQAIREAAAQAAKAQREMILSRKDAVQKHKSDAAAAAGQVSDTERQRREAYLKKQREVLLDMQKQRREEELTEYLQNKPKVEAKKASKDEEMDAKRNELRMSLARQIKQQMIAKQAEMGSGAQQ